MPLAETLELHHACVPMAYADGAWRVRLIHGRKGVFTMDQFSEETLDPLSMRQAVSSQAIADFSGLSVALATPSPPG